MAELTRRGGLILDAVTKRYAETEIPAVDAVSLDIRAGEFLSLLGPSGCGKSTILRMIAGFETVSSGRILKDGTVLASPETHIAPERRRMGMVFQSYALWPHMTVAENVAYPLRVRGLKGAEKARRLEEALDAVSLLSFRDRLPKDLSGGQRQRVALGRCLVMEPDVILLDEPLANLDRHLKAAMEETFRDFHRRTGASMVYVTHDQSEAMALSDRIAVLDHGRLVQCDAPRALYERPRNETVARLIGQRSMVVVPGGGVKPAQDDPLTGEALMDLLRTLQASPPVGDDTLLIRPEHVALVPPGPDALATTVESCVYHGERFLLRLALADGQTLLAYAPEPQALGQPVAVAVQRAWPVAPG
ncbi:MAG: ABC transporter ATP-binding protein [Pseudomonadota bacterium]